MLSIKDALAVGASIVASFGGSVALILLFSSYLGKVWAQRFMDREKNDHERALEELRNRFEKENEKYRTFLRNSEFLFNKQYEAASELVAFSASIIPIKRHSEEEWEEAIDRIASKLDNHLGIINIFLSKHGAILSEKVKDHLNTALSRATDGSFGFENGELTRKGAKATDAFVEAVQAAEKQILKEVRSQTIPM